MNVLFTPQNISAFSSSVFRLTGFLVFILLMPNTLLAFNQQYFTGQVSFLKVHVLQAQDMPVGEVVPVSPVIAFKLRNVSMTNENAKYVNCDQDQVYYLHKGNDTDWSATKDRKLEMFYLLQQSLAEQSYVMVDVVGSNSTSSNVLDCSVKSIYLWSDNLK